MYRITRAWGEVKGFDAIRNVTKLFLPYTRKMKSFEPANSSHSLHFSTGLPTQVKNVLFNFVHRGKYQYSRHLPSQDSFHHHHDQRSHHPFHNSFFLEKVVVLDYEHHVMVPSWCNLLRLNLSFLETTEKNSTLSTFTSFIIICL